MLDTVYVTGTVAEKYQTPSMLQERWLRNVSHRPCYMGGGCGFGKARRLCKYKEFEKSYLFNTYVLCKKSSELSYIIYY